MSTTTALSAEALLAAVEAEIRAFPLRPGEDRYVVLVDDEGRETDIPLRQFRLRLLNGERVGDREIFITPGTYRAGPQ